MTSETTAVATAVIVTAGGSGIGAATAIRLAAAGHRVVVADLSLDAARDVADRIEALGGRATPVLCDVRSETDIVAAVGAATREDDRLVTVVSNAGVGAQGTVDTLSAETWDEVFATNVRSAFLLAKHSVPALRDAGGGCFLVTASLGGVLPGNGTLVYSATKAALINMVRTMALDLGPDRIRVNCVCPGATDTPGLRAQLAQAGLSEEAYSAMVPLGRIASADDIAATFAFLASDEARQITGQATIVDGGQQAGMFMPPPPS